MFSCYDPVWRFSKSRRALRTTSRCHLRGLWLGLALALLTHAADAGTQRAIELRVLTYNTHGLPAWIAWDRPEYRFPLIGRRLNAYDVALVQEDFYHHEHLLAAVQHPTISRGNAGSGLTTLLKADGVRLVDSEQVRYRDCAGWLLNRSDCLANKGFLRTRLELPGGMQVDVVNTHLDSGEDMVDHKARRAQLDTLISHVKRATPAGALVLGGDFNLDRNEPRDRALLERLIAELGLTDSEALDGSTAGWSHVDYLFYRSGPGTYLEVLEAGEAAEFTVEGVPLSDHPALNLRLRIIAR